MEYTTSFAVIVAHEVDGSAVVQKITLDTYHFQNQMSLSKLKLRTLDQTHNIKLVWLIQVQVFLCY